MKPLKNKAMMQNKAAFGGNNGKYMPISREIFYTGGMEP